MMVCSVKSLQGRSLPGEREKQWREKGAALRNGNANSLTVSRQRWGIYIFTQTTETFRGAAGGAAGEKPAQAGLLPWAGGWEAAGQSGAFVACIIW